MGKIAIHGFGRIGRSAMKAALKRGLFVPASISDIKDLPTLAALFEVDSNYGRWPQPVSAEGSTMIVGDDKIPYFETSQSLPDWGALGVELVIDCTGRATRRAGAQAHLDRGAKRVLVSAASKSREDADAFLLPGINLDQYDPDKHFIVSMASCTTNALAPVVKVLLENVGLKSGLFTTVHAYTNTQSLTDQPMGDRRDSWAAAENIIPSSSGAAKALKFIWPDLNMTGKAYRVPVRTGSIVEATVVTDRATSAEELNDMFRKAATSAPLQGVMSVLEGEWASSRIVGDEHSSIIDLPLTQVMGGTLVTVAAWYDNEMGYSTRLADTAAFLVK
ncbi:type I glyceraldehyde-3-phosphate dehydrogenase [Aggregatilinea lenta]|uniref:type I glyceraldehyde-3-phosphate dehydrogenase n=1 Tax=Aggregatilinea lenta TaxID=913108 RepID=UPI000E5A783C|nr:glyceraldehyde 3-phosphate dehydrogenase NAD-binding domain-containing protein [Aggregatilinea lenta]